MDIRVCWWIRHGPVCQEERSPSLQRELYGTLQEWERFPLQVRILTVRRKYFFCPPVPSEVVIWPFVGARGKCLWELSVRILGGVFRWNTFTLFAALISDVSCCSYFCTDVFIHLASHAVVQQNHVQEFVTHIFANAFCNCFYYFIFQFINSSFIISRCIWAAVGILRIMIKVKLYNCHPRQLLYILCSIICIKVWKFWQTHFSLICIKVGKL